MSFWRFFCLALSLFVDPALTSLLAIDYGSDSIKVSLMKPGVPFDVVLDRDSKRKILSSVGWKGEERSFGADAFNLATRYPSDSFPSLKVLQGGSLNPESSTFYATLFPYLKVLETPRHTYSFQRPSGLVYTNEELIAMQFSYVKELAQTLAGGEKITDAVITVPGYYSQFERQAVLDSVAIAGMRAISLIHDGMAIAVNFAMTRTFPTPETHVVYDAGASGVRATVVRFSTTSSPTTPSSSSTGSKATAIQSQDITHIEVEGYGFDRSMGGLVLDSRLRDIITHDFETKYGQSLKGESRAFAKLWNNLTKVKAILSTNPDTHVAIESFLGDLDLRLQIPRSSFERACEDLKPRFAQPILDALKQAGLGLDDITSVILAGGSSRTPMVQSAVKLAVGGEKIAQYVNADEAAVLGAAFYGASLSRQFKTKEIKIQDLLADYDIHLAYSPETSTGRPANTLIFPSGSKLGSKKILTLKRKDDFTITVAYKESTSVLPPLDIFDATILGINDAIANLTSRGAVGPVIKLTMSLSESGMTTVQEAIAFGEIRDESITDKFQGLFGSPSTKYLSSMGGPSASTPSHNVETAAEEFKKTIPVTIPLKVLFRPLSISPMSSTDKAQSRARLVALDKAEHARARKEEARNYLEGYLYRLRDLLDGDSTTPFFEFSKEEERKTLDEQMLIAMAWISEHEETADTMDFWEKRNSLELLERPIQNRYQEAEAGPKAYADLQQALAAGRIFLHSARENATIENAQDIPPKYTTEELAVIEDRLTEDEQWLKANVEIQKQQKKNDDPVLLAAEMKARGVTLQNQVMKLLRRKNTVAPKATNSPTSTVSPDLVSEPEVTTTTIPKPLHIDL